MTHFRVAEVTKHNSTRTRVSNNLLLITKISLFMTVGFNSAEEVQIESEFNEKFLFYLADMSIQDGKVVDQLNMLDLDSATTEKNAKQKKIGKTMREHQLKLDEKASKPKMKEER